MVGRWDSTELNKIETDSTFLLLHETTQKMDFLLDIMNNYFDDEVPMEMALMGSILIDDTFELTFDDYYALGNFILQKN